MSFHDMLTNWSSGDEHLFINRVLGSSSDKVKLDQEKINKLSREVTLFLRSHQREFRERDLTSLNRVCTHLSSLEKETHLAIPLIKEVQAVMQSLQVTKQTIERIRTFFKENPKDDRIEWVSVPFDNDKQLLEQFPAIIEEFDFTNEERAKLATCMKHSFQRVVASTITPSLSPREKLEALRKVFQPAIEILCKCNLPFPQLKSMMQELITLAGDACPPFAALLTSEMLDSLHLTRNEKVELVDYLFSICFRRSRMEDFIKNAIDNLLSYGLPKLSLLPILTKGLAAYPTAISRMMVEVNSILQLTDTQRLRLAEATILGCIYGSYNVDLQSFQLTHAQQYSVLQTIARRGNIYIPSEILSTFTEEERYQLALTVARSSPGIFFTSIEAHYSLTRDHLITVATIAWQELKKSGYISDILSFKRYVPELQDEKGFSEAIIEISQKNPRSVLIELQEWKKKVAGTHPPISPSECRKIGAEILLCNPSVVDDRYNRENLSALLSEGDLSHEPELQTVLDAEKIIGEQRAVRFSNPFFANLYERNRPIQNVFQLRWLGTCAFLTRVHNIPTAQLNSCRPAIEAIFRMRKPAIRSALTTILFQKLLLAPPRQIRLWQLLSTHYGLNPLLALASVPLVVGAPSSFLRSFQGIMSCLSSPALRNSNRLEGVLRNLLTVVQDASTPLAEKRRLLQVAFPHDITSGTTNREKISTLATRFQFLSATLSLGISSRLARASSYQEIEDMCRETFLKEFDLGTVSDFSRKFLGTFEQMQDPQALITYGAGLKRLLSPEREQMLTAFKNFILDVLEGRHQANRYAPIPGDHLEKIFKEREELRKSWIEGESVPFDEFIQDQGLIVREEINIQRPLQQLFNANQLRGEEYPNLIRCLQNHTQQSALEESLNEGLKKIATEMRGVRGEAQQKLQGQLDRTRLELNLIKLLKGGQDNKERTEILNVIIDRFARKLFPPEHPVMGTLRALQKELSQTLADEGGGQWTISDTDQWEDLFMMGSMIGSCQSVSGEPADNKCLLGYVLDGKTRMIAIKDEEGRLIARCIVRLLWDEQSQRPVMYREAVFGIYNPLPLIYRQAIDRMCLQRAQKLGVALATEHPSGTPSTVTLRSISTRRTPYEYVEGIFVTNGNYTLPNVRFVQPSSAAPKSA